MTVHERPTVDLTDEQLLRNVAQTTAAIDAFVRALIPQVQAAARTFAELGRQLQAAGLIDADGNPTQPRDRPAWQTPYGPAPRRR